MTVYADVLFLVNLYVDFFLLWCDDRVLRLQTGVWRLLGGALTGALCSLACLLPGQPAWASFLWGGISAVLTAGAAFLPGPLGSFCRLPCACGGFPCCWRACACSSFSGPPREIWR